MWQQTHHVPNNTIATMKAFYITTQGLLTTFPVGLCGVLKIIALVFSLKADSSSSLSKTQSLVEVAFSF